MRPVLALFSALALALSAALFVAIPASAVGPQDGSAPTAAPADPSLTPTPAPETAPADQVSAATPIPSPSPTPTPSLLAAASSSPVPDSSPAPDPAPAPPVFPDIPVIPDPPLAPAQPVAPDPPLAPAPDPPAAPDPSSAPQTPSVPAPPALRAEPPSSPAPTIPGRPAISYHFSPAALSTVGSLAFGATGLDLYSLDGSGPHFTTSCVWNWSPPFCSFSALAPGTWELEAHDPWPWFHDFFSAAAAAYFVVPATPTLAAVDSGAQTVTFHGRGTAGGRVTVQGPGGVVVCSASVDRVGQWSCTSRPMPAGDYGFTAIQTDVSSGAVSHRGRGAYVPGGRSARTAPVRVTLAPPPPPTMTPSIDYTFSPGAVTVGGTPSVGSTIVHVTLSPWAPGTDAAAVHGCAFGEASASCSFSQLSPGVWRVVSVEDTGDGVTRSAGSVQDYLVIPDAPAIVASVGDSGSTVSLSGTGVPGDRIHVLDENGAAVCETVAVDTGDWACATAPLASGPHAFSAYQEDEGAGENDAVGEHYVPGGSSPLAYSRQVTVAPAPTTIDPNSWSFAIDGVDLVGLHVGDRFTITGHGLPAGLSISVVLHSTPVVLGATTVGADGAFSLDASVPSDTEPGQHEVIVSVSGDGIVPTSKSVDVTVLAPEAVIAATGPALADAVPDRETVEAPVTEPAVPFSAVSPPVTPTEKAPPRAKPAAAPAEPPAPAVAPNILTNAIGTLQDVLAHPQKISSSIAIGLVLIIFATLPAHLLNATLSEQYERFARRLPKPRKPPRWFVAASAWLNREQVVGVLSIIVVTALLFGFADPTFGFTLASLRLFLACAVALFFVGYVANAVTKAIAHRQWDIDVAISVRPLGLILTVVGVILSRFLNFSPGFLVGLILGLTIASKKSTQTEAWKIVLTRTVILLAMGIAAWGAFSVLSTEHETEESFGSALFAETLVAITTESLVALVVVLLPFRFLEGERLYQHSKLLWSAVYLLVVSSFLVAVVSWDGNWQVLGGSFWLWTAVVVLFAATCLGIYLYFRFWAPPLYVEGEPDDERVPISDEA